MIPFFTQHELENFAKLAGTRYYKKDITLGLQLKESIFLKTNYWGSAVKPDGWEIIQDNVWQISGYYKEYSWARLFKKGDSGEMIFFTVGVDADRKSLIYKLDCQHEHRHEQRRLTKSQYDNFKKVVKDNNLKWQQISAGDIANYNWEKLFTFTKKFILENEKVYTEAIDSVWSEGMDRVARICWNTNGWVIPSGVKGKSKDFKSHEGSYGYGHEEWLFDLDKTIGGYHYSFLEPIRQQHDAFAGKNYNVILYSKNGISKNNYIIGEIKNLEVLYPKDNLEIINLYKEKGWFREMEEQILDVVPNSEGFSNFKDIDLFNVRFKPENVTIYPEYLNVLDVNFQISSLRYIFLKDRRSSDEKSSLISKSYQFDPSKEHSGLPTKAGYNKKPGHIEMFLKHNLISEKLTKFLRDKYGKQAVSFEQPTGKGTKIDIALKYADVHTLFEIKTYQVLRLNIREAIGQLVEYNHWPNEKLAKELVIVSDLPADEETKTYLESLRSLYNFPLYYQQFDLDAEELTEKV